MTRDLSARRAVALASLTAATDLQVVVAATQASAGTGVVAVALDESGRLCWAVTAELATSPDGAVTLLGGGSAGRFALDLDALDGSVAELQFLVRPGTGSDVALGGSGHGGITATVEAAGDAVAHFACPPAAVPAGCAVVMLVLQRRDGWQLLPVGESGTDPLRSERPQPHTDHPPGRLPAPSPLDPPPPPPVAASPDRWVRARLRRSGIDERLASQAPELVDVAQQADAVLDRAGLGDHTARVALCLDMSFSMFRLYQTGKIQRFADKVLALATRLDPNGMVEVFCFGSEATFAGELHIGNRSSFVNMLMTQYELQKGTYYGKAMSAIRLHFFGDAGPRDAPWPATEPVYVMFLTDGETFDPALTRNEVRWSAYEPIFWQFMAVGASREELATKGVFSRLRGLFAPNFELLRELDDLEGRYVNNADFFAVRGPDDLSDAELFASMMHEYPAWVVEAWSRGLLVEGH